MKKIFFLFSFCVAQLLNAQQGKYVFFCEEKDVNVSINVKGEYQGNYARSDIYYEKVDALNHKVKKVKLSDGVFNGMTNFIIDETLVSGSSLKIKEEKYDGKIFYIVSVRPLNDKKPLQSKYYSASKGAFDDAAASKEYDILVPFATKAKAEAFITDLRNYIK